MSRALATALALALLLVRSPARAQETSAPERSPILVTFDLHMDPMGANEQIGRRLYDQWTEATEWLLETVDRHGARLSFTMVGQYAEFALEDRDRSFPIVRRLYESGGSVGTHSHDWVREDEFRWRSAGRGGSSASQVWADDVGAVDRLVAEVFDLEDPAAIRAINNLRGTHVPSDARERYALFQKYGIEVSQAGPGEDFVGLFDHYLFHPFRSSAANELAEDRDGPVILTQAGPVLGQVGVHKGIEQDMSLPRVQARFLGEVLNWLHDARTGAPDRVWCFGWAVHGSDVTASGVSRKHVEPLLAWLEANFMDRRIGGFELARFSSYHEEADAYRAWETANPDLASKAYPSTKRDWSVYPWLAPVAAYLFDADYVETIQAGRSVQAHRLASGDLLGDVHPIVVLLPDGEGATTADLSAIDAADWMAIDTATGEARKVEAGKVPVAPAGSIAVPAASHVTLDEQKARIDSARAGDLRSLSQGGRKGPGAGREGGPQGGQGPRGGREGEGRGLMRLDADGDGSIDRDEFPGDEEAFEELDGNGDGKIDETEAGRAGPRKNRDR